MKCGVIKMTSKEALEKLRLLAVNSESDEEVKFLKEYYKRFFKNADR